MSLTETETEQMKRLYHSQYGHLQVREQRNFYTIDEETAQSLVRKGLAEYTSIAMTQFCRLTRDGIAVVLRESRE